MIARTLPLVLLLAAGGTAAAQSLTPRTLKRVEDTIVVDAKVLGARLMGVPRAQVRFYACRDGFMTPIQFQIDERNDAGEYCYDKGAVNGRRRDKDRGRIDANDELVLCVRDAGDRASEAVQASVPDFTTIQELQLRDPIDGGLAWVYAYHFERLSVPPALTDDYVSLRVEKHENDERTYHWRGELFAFNNDRSRLNAVRATFATLVNRDEDIKTKTNMLDSTQVRAVVSFMWITVVRQSNDIRVDIGGRIDGPLRMVAENRMKLYLALGIWVEAPESFIILWRNKFSMPSKVDCPVNLDEGDESSYSLAMDFNKKAMKQGWEFYNQHNLKPVKIDGKMSKAEKNLDMTYPEWNVVFGKGGAVITKFVIPPVCRKKKGSRLIYIDDAKYKRPDDEEGIEFEPGAIGYNGYLMDMHGLRKGNYPGNYIVWYAPAPFKVGDEQAFMNEYDKPIVVTRPKRVRKKKKPLGKKKRAK
jgi:hypothetical protein